ncbi:MAG: hypothetical protein V1828_01900 [Candidatus Omnitrophota bacterium]
MHIAFLLIESFLFPADRPGPLKFVPPFLRLFPGLFIYDDQVLPVNRDQVFFRPGYLLSLAGHGVAHHFGLSPVPDPGIFLIFKDSGNSGDVPSAALVSPGGDFLFV